MTTTSPLPGSPWARHCPDAYPAGWFAALGLAALPPGFTRFATPAEEAVITGRTENSSPDRPSGGPPARSGNATPGDRWRELNRFVDLELRGRTRSEVAVWLVLFRDARGGMSRTGQSDLARRAGLTIRGVQKAIAGLAAAGFISVVRRGRLGAGVSTYRVGLPARTP